MRRRLATCMADLVRLGQAVPVYPNTDSGWRHYGTGREFLPADGDRVASTLRYLTSMVSVSEGTIAYRAKPVVRTAGVVYWNVSLASGGVPPYIGTTGAVHGFRANATTVIYGNGGSAADVEETVTARWLADSQIDIAINNTSSPPIALSGNIATSNHLCIGSGYGAYYANGYVGPVIISQRRKPDGWITALVAAGWSDIVRIFTDFLDADDVLIPLWGDSVAYRKVSGTGIPFDKGLNLVFDGNSLTYSTYPDFCVALLGDYNLLSANKAVGGQTTPDMISDAATEIDVLLNPHRHNICIAWEWINDPGDLETRRANMVTYCQARQAAGWKVVLVSSISKNTEVYQSLEAQNTWIRTNWATCSDALADVGADPNIGCPGNYENAYFADGVHLTEAGYAIVAGIVKTAIESLL